MFSFMGVLKIRPGHAIIQLGRHSLHSGNLLTERLSKYMAKKDRILYVCSECGFESPKWNGRCQGCGSWNTLEEVVPLQMGSSNRKTMDLSDRVRVIGDIDTDSEVRYHTGCGELDRVLGGGLVKGSIVLLGG